MPKAHEIRQRLQMLLDDPIAGIHEDVPVFLHAIEWIGFAQHYSDAAEALFQRSGPASGLPRLLLSGHSVECALKACLVAKAQPVPRIHDLVALADLVMNLGFVLYEPELVTIVHLDSVFSQDLVSRTRFRVRYPTGQFESNVRVYASHQLVARIVASLASQASRYNEYANREQWSGERGDA